MQAHDLELIGATNIDLLQLGGSGATVNMFDADVLMAADSHVRVPTQAAVVAYVNAVVPGDGNLIFQGDSKVEVTDTGSNGSIMIVADGQEAINVSADSQRMGDGDTNVFVSQTANNVTFTANNVLTMTVSEGQLKVHGDLAIDGTTFVVNNQEVTTADNIIVLNDGEVGAGVTGIKAGIEVDRGSLTNYQFIFNETTDNFRIGEIGSLQAVATREDTPTNAIIPFWNSTTSMFETANSPFKKKTSFAHLLANGILAMATTGAGISVHDTNGTSPVIQLRDDANTILSQMWVTSDNLYIDQGINTSGGSTVSLRAYNGSTYQYLFRGTQGGTVRLYHNGSAVAITNANGISGATWG